MENVSAGVLKNKEQYLRSNGKTEQWCIKTYIINLNEIVTNNMTINRVKLFQHLGLTLDETLWFDDHVDFLSRSLIKYFWIFNKVK